MLAQLRYHYKDPYIQKRMPEHTLLRLFAELGWMKEKEAEEKHQQNQGAQHYDGTTRG